MTDSHDKTKRSVRAEWLGDYKTNIIIRDTHHINGDEMPQYGGDDTGPMPTELLLAGLASCMCLAVTYMARKQRIEIHDVSVTAWAEKDMKEFRFQQINLRVEGDLPTEEMEKLVNRAKPYCFVSNTLIQGCPILVESQSTVDTNVSGAQ